MELASTLEPELLQHLRDTRPLPAEQPVQAKIEPWQDCRSDTAVGLGDPPILPASKGVGVQGSGEGVDHPVFAHARRLVLRILLAAVAVLTVGTNDLYGKVRRAVYERVADTVAVCLGDEEQVRHTPAPLTGKTHEHVPADDAETTKLREVAKQ